MTAIHLAAHCSCFTNRSNLGPGEWERSYDCHHQKASHSSLALAALTTAAFSESPSTSAGLAFHTWGMPPCEMYPSLFRTSPTTHFPCSVDMK